MSRNVSLAALMLLCCAAGPASQPATATRATTTRATALPEPPVIHRMKAGKRGADSWYAARSTGSGFTVSTPAPFNDITVSHVEPDGSRVTTHMIAATTTPG